MSNILKQTTISLISAFLISLAGCATVGLVKNPITADDYYKRGQYYFSYAGGFEAKKAIHEFNQAIKINPGFVDAYIQRGNCFTTFDLDLAIADYKRAIELRPSDETLYSKVAEFYYRKGDYDLAALEFGKAINANPNNWQVYYSRALFYGEIEDFEKAINDFEKINSLNPEQWYPYYLKAQLLERLECIDESIEAYKIAGDKIPSKEADAALGFIAGGIFGAWTAWESSLGYSASQRKTMIDDKIEDLKKRKAETHHTDKFTDDKPVEIGMNRLLVIKKIMRNEKIIYNSVLSVISSRAFKDANEGCLTVYDFKDDRLASIRNISFETIRKLPKDSFPSAEDTRRNGKLFGMPKQQFLDAARRTNIIISDSEKVTIALGEVDYVKDKRLKSFFFENGKFLSYGVIVKKLW